MAETIGKTIANAATLVIKDVSKKVRLKMENTTQNGLQSTIPLKMEVLNRSAAPELTIAFPMESDDARMINKSRFIFFFILSISDIPNRT